MARDDLIGRAGNPDDGPLDFGAGVPHRLEKRAVRCSFNPLLRPVTDHNNLLHHKKNRYQPICADNGFQGFLNQLWLDYYSDPELILVDNIPAHFLVFPSLND